MKKTVISFVKAVVVLAVSAPAGLWAQPEQTAPQKPVVIHLSTDKLPLANDGKIPSAKELLETRKLNQKVLENAIRYRIGGNSGGGGDEDGIEFQRLAFQALNNLRTRNPELYSAVAKYNLEALVETMNVIVIEEPLDVETKEYLQDSAAANFPDANTIVVTRPRWRAIQDMAIRERIALHETLSLKYIESTGYYPISARYSAGASSAPESSKEALITDRIKQLRALSPGVTMLDAFRANFAESQDRIVIHDIRKFSDSRKYHCAWVTANLDGSNQSLVKIGMLSVSEKRGFFVSEDDTTGLDPKYMRQVTDKEMSMEGNVMRMMDFDYRVMTVRKGFGSLAFRWTDTEPSGHRRLAYGYCAAK